MQKARIRQRHHVVSLRFGLGPDQCTAPAGHRQQRQRAALGETLIGNTRVPLAADDIGNNRGLPVRAHLAVDTQLLQQARTAAVSQHQQIGRLLVHLPILLYLQQPASASGFSAHHPRRRLPLHHPLVQRA